MKIERDRWDEEVRYRPAKEEVDTGSREEDERKWGVRLSQNSQEEIAHKQHVSGSLPL